MRLLKAKKPFPFFKLPIEIRNIVYEKVFSTPLDDRTITPDPTYSRRHYNKACRAWGRKVIDRTVNNGLALLQSCQQAHEEAAAVLYGQNTFYFDDFQHYYPYAVWSGSGRKTYAIEVSAHCEFCRRHAKTGEYEDRCYSTYSRGQHFIDIPFTDFVTMKSWLSTIGEKNRLRIRQIQIHFLDSQFAKVQPAYHWTMGRYPGKPCSVGGDVLVEALRFLASSHNLDTFGIYFESSPKDNSDFADVRRREHREAFGHLFSTVYDPHSDKMQKALSSITGIRKLECEDITGVGGRNRDEMLAIRADYRKVKAAMENGYKRLPDLEAPVLWSRPYVDQVEWVMQDPKPKAQRKGRITPFVSIPKY